jgi:hypothetical protein
MTANPSNTVMVIRRLEIVLRRVLGNAHDDVGEEIMRAP